MSKPTTSFVSRSALKKRAILLALLALIVGGISYPPAANKVIDTLNYWVGTHFGRIEKGFVLGLDLQGGTHLDYEADVSQVTANERASALNGVRDVIERRVNSIGVSEPSITTARAGDSWRVSVELAGVRDINQAIKLIGETPILEFKEQNSEPARSLTDEEKAKMEADNKAAAAKANEDLAKAKANPSVVEELAKDHSSDDASKALGGDLGFIKDKQQYIDIFEATKNLGAGQVYEKVIETTDSFIVAKVEETKAADPEIQARHILIQFAGATSAPTTTTATKDEAKKRLEEIQKEVRPENFAESAKKYSEEPGADESGGDLGWFGKGVMVEDFEKAVFGLKTGEISNIVETQFGYHLIYKTGERPVNDVRVRAVFAKKTLESDILPPQSEWKATQLTGKQLDRAQLDFDQNVGSAQVSLKFDDEGKQLFAEITKRNLGKPVAIFLDGEPISIPTVQSEITGGEAVITGNFTIDEAKLLAQRLQAGALPVPIKLIAQQSVGPTLGQDSVDKSVVAGLLGFLLVAIFMIVWYRLPGLIAVVALLLYVGISFSVFKLLPVTLTLSGIAGFILSIGMAVDANVLIFERLKEEFKLGKTWQQALEEAFRRAWTSIRDGNLTTLISCGVLYWFSSAVIKGFALTLAIGVMLSMFSAIVVTRTLMRVAMSSSLVKRAPWLFMIPRQAEEKK
ncbi:MAG: protein translocase subunit SecD [Patescibacteria group bacterium]|nr:protein translocase subunit SecD [Patescibacteria group bacterium]